jgi:hypothetical protein
MDIRKLMAAMFFLSNSLFADILTLVFILKVEIYDVLVNNINKFPGMNQLTEGN